MFFAEPTCLSDPDSQAHLVSTLSSIFGVLFSRAQRQSQPSSLNGLKFTGNDTFTKGCCVFFQSGKWNRSFLSGFHRFPKAFINFSMVFIYFPWFSVISPRCPSISSWASMGSFMFIDVSLVFINFCKVFIDFLLAFRFFIYFSMVFSDFSMMFIDVQWFSSISPRFSLFFPIMFITTIHVFHQWFHGAHGCSFYMSMVFISHGFPLYFYGLQLFFNGVHWVCAGCSSMFPVFLFMFSLFIDFARVCCNDFRWFSCVQWFGAYK